MSAILGPNMANSLIWLTALLLESQWEQLYPQSTYPLACLNVVSDVGKVRCSSGFVEFYMALVDMIEPKVIMKDMAQGISATNP